MKSSQVPRTLSYPDVALPYFLEQSFISHPNQTAISFLGKTLTYKQLWERSCSFAGFIRSLGVQPGDRVGIILPNTPQAVIAYYGAMLAGAVVVMFNPLYSEREIHQQAVDSGILILVVFDQLFHKVQSAIEGMSPEVEHLIVTSLQDYLPFPKNLLYSYQQKTKGQSLSIPYSASVHSFVKGVVHTPARKPEVVVHHSDLALLQYTGGTTGVAKGVMLTHRNLVANTLQARSWVYEAKEANETVLCALPFFHVYGMTIGMNLAVILSAKMIIVPRFFPAEVLSLIQSQKPTLFPGAPTMYIALINHPDIKKYNLSSIKACISGSAPLPLEVQETFERLTGGRLVEGYGLTESSPVTHCNPIWGYRKNGTIGVPWPDTEAKVVDPQTFTEMPVGTPGELVVKGPQVMKGYWKRPDETAETMHEGWLLTGDIAVMDEEGFFSIVDRRKNMIIAGGYNIYPREIEEVLFEHPAVQEAAVIGVADTYRGETVKAFIVLKERATVTKEDLDSFCRKRLAKYKVPRLYEFRAELPKTTIGKVLKRVLLDEQQAHSETAASEQEQ